MKPKLYLETFGCQMNVLDSELVLGQLRAQGYQSVEEPDDADVVLYNTCSVREHAEQKVWSRLGELRQTKADKPHLVVGVIGCMAERDGTDMLRRFPHVDILCGPGELDRLPAMVHNAVLTNHAPNLDQLSPDVAIRRTPQIALMGEAVRRTSTLAAAEDHLELLDLSRSVSPADDVVQAYVRITRGCDKFCTYCVVPYTRGPEVHRPPKNIIDEVKMLADAGAREVTLLGQTINHYHYKHPDGRSTTFGALLHLIHDAVPHLPRLRFVTSYPRDFTDEALQAMRDCTRICRYLHVPAQSGSDRILKAMNRGYTAGQYDDFVGRAREYMPDISLASDFIVGFPTETDEDFQTSLDLVRRHRFKNSFIFKYSPRPGTTAITRFADDVPESVKRTRNNLLLAAQGEVSAENNRAMVGQTVELLVEGESKLVSRKAAYPSSSTAATPVVSRVELGWEKRAAKSDSEPAAACATAPPTVAEQQGTHHRTQLVGRTRGDQVVVFDGPLALKGQLLHVRITDARQMTLFGERT